MGLVAFFTSPDRKFYTPKRLRDGRLENGKKYNLHVRISL